VKEREGSLISLIANLFLSIVALPLSLIFSSTGALLLKCSGKNYLFERIHPERMREASARFSRIFAYNVGFLPGKLAEKLTVGDFPFSTEERREQIASTLNEALDTHNVILLEEAVDFGLIRKISKVMKESGRSVCIYSRISKNPLAPGIASGLCVISRRPLDGFKVGSLPGNELFFNRAFVRFRLPSGVQVVHSHLRAGSNEAPRFRQLRHIASSLIEKVGMLIGDYNFGDRARGNIQVGVPDLGVVVHHLNEPSMRNPEKGETYPDLATSFGDLARKVDVQVHPHYELSDHLPYTVQC